jgi:tetratricopeptide (TPR) repeat protein
MKELRRAGDGGDMRIAKVFFNEALAADRGFARAQAGLCRSELGRFENKQDADIFGNAQAACLLAAKMDPELREVNLALGELNRIGGNLAKANEHYAKVQDDPVLGPTAHVGMGKVQSAEGRHDLALGHFEHALALRPDDASIHRAIGFQHYLDEHLDKAIESYRRATSLEPGNADAWSSLGGLHLADGNTAAAAAAFERSIAIEPTDIGLTNFGALKYAGGDFAGAADLFRRATVLEPGDFRLWGNLGEALLEVPGGTTQAREPFLRAAELAARYVQVKPDDAQALALLAWYRANLGDSAGARELAARAEALATARGEVALRNAQTFVSLGDEAAARERLDRARREGVAEDRIQTTPVFRRLPGAGSGKTALQGGKR